jgi:hypothetical protein
MLDFGFILTAAQTFALTATAWVAWYQLGALRKDQQAWKTLEACEKYESDYVLYCVLTKLRDVRDSGDLKNNPRPYRAEATLLLNYLEGIAIGAHQGFYNESIVRDHLEAVIIDHVFEFLDVEMAKRMELDPRRFENLKSLSDRWSQLPRPSFKL